MDELELIHLLEEDMRKDISSIDLTPEQEEDITCAEVKGWYLETEKLIRVLGNILSVPMTQAINQLRYAGHHVLKAVTDEEGNEITFSVEDEELFDMCIEYFLYDNEYDLRNELLDEGE